MKHIANVMSFEELNTAQEATVGRIFQHKKGYYIVDMLNGFYKLFDCYVDACARARNQKDTYFINP